MTRGAWWSLFGARFFSVCAVLIGLCAGLYISVIGAAFVCFDTCETPDFYFSHMALGSVLFEIPCVALELVAFALFLAHCRVTKQPRLIILPAVFLVVAGVVGAAALWALMLHGQATLPVTGDGLLAESPVESWQRMWGLAVTGVAVVWSGVLTFLQRGGV